MLEHEVNLSKKGQRVVTQFFGEELLYDYLTDNLDSERQKSIESYLKYSADAQLEAEKIVKSIEYTKQLSSCKVRSETIDAVISSSANWTYLLSKLKLSRFPQSIVWGMESIVVTIGMVIVLILIPWQKMTDEAFWHSGSELVLAEVFRVNPVVDVYEKPEFEDEVEKINIASNNVQLTKEQVINSTTKEVVESNATGSVSGTAEKSDIKPQARINTKISSLKTSSQNIITPNTSLEGDGVQESSDGNTDKSNSLANSNQISSQQDQNSSTQAVIQGFLFRGTLPVTNMGSVSDKVKDKIIELGGRKAGSVDLGWKKSYFHFTIPAAKYDELIVFLNLYGTLKVTKERHPRVMPENIHRLIITLEEVQK